MRVGYINDAILTDMANAIRERTGTSVSYTPREMSDAISSIRSQIIFNGDIVNIVSRTATHISNDTTTKIGRHALAHCYSLEKATFNAATSIDYGAFYNCKNLKSVEFPLVETIGMSAFFGCAFTELNLKSIKSIGSDAFQGCSSLEKVSLGSTETDTNTTSIQGFNNCSSLTTLILWAPLDRVTSVWSVGSLQGTPIANGTGYIYVPRIQLDINGTWGYLNLESWQPYRSQFRAIEDYPEICDPNYSPELEIPEDATRVYLAVNQTYSKQLYAEFEDADITVNNAEVVVSDSTVVNARCEEDDSWEPYLYITGLKEGTVLVELPQIDYSYHVTVTPSVEHTIYKYGQVEIPIAEEGFEEDTVTVISCPSWLECQVSYDDMTVFIYDNGVGKGKTGYVVIDSEMNGPMTYIVKSGY